MFVRETRGNRKKTHVIIKRSRRCIDAVHHPSEFMTIFTRTSRRARENDGNNAEEVDQKEIWPEDHPDGSRDSTTHIRSESKLSSRSSRTSALCMLYAVAESVTCRPRYTLSFILLWHVVIPYSLGVKSSQQLLRKRNEGMRKRARHDLTRQDSVMDLHASRTTRAIRPHGCSTARHMNTTGLSLSHTHAHTRTHAHTHTLTHTGKFFRTRIAAHVQTDKDEHSYRTLRLKHTETYKNSFTYHGTLYSETAARFHCDAYRTIRTCMCAHMKF